MSTECTQTSFFFEPHGRRDVVARFDGGAITSDAGALLLRQVDQHLDLLPRLAACFDDRRDPQRIEHSVEQLVSQRVYALALGYEDLNDHDELRTDPLLALLAGKTYLEGRERKREPDRGKALAGKSTLHRLERSTESADRYKKIGCDFERVDRLLVELFIEAHPTPPEEIILDIDATDTPLYGSQEGRFFHGYYNHYCYLPLYIFAGEHLLCARQREANQDPAVGAQPEIERIVKQIREVWPPVRIVVRGDSGFGREQLMSWCEANGVEFVLGLQRNERLRKLIEEAMQKVAATQKQTGLAAREFVELEYQTRESWSRARRVVAKAEQLEGKENPRYVVTSLGAEGWKAQALYEELYCQRGEMENRIKEQLSLFVDRMSTQTMRANQLRLYLSSLAYALLVGLRRLGLAGTRWARAQTETIRRVLLKVGAQVRGTVRKVWVSMSSGYAYVGLFGEVYEALRRPKVKPVAV